ncbi:coxsackievirus and adenovirus receptor homolog [Oreochromis niloticus]|uniref:coxsackievirus and adenovirus receptor homolog n=1 Tax=Oreochromis niloticus TaxID=8128 RepID=UPI0009058BFC|nr:coxsackievirus and adenovirus receptor homolog [Oreochromis niloticus]
MIFQQKNCCISSMPLRSRYFNTKFVLWILIFMGIFDPLIKDSVCALEITSHIKNYYVARDSSVTLNCKFVLESENLGYTEIEWNIVPSDRQQDDEIIIWYTGGVLYSNLYEPLKNRVHFASPDPQDGDASMRILDLKLTDMGTYQCKVKRLPEFGMKNFNLFVMERPSTPVCYIDGEEVEGNSLRMRCRSSQGTPPLNYNWSKASGNKMLPQTAFVDTTAGDLYLRKITESDTGTYRCVVVSLVGMEECEVTLSSPLRHTTQQTINNGTTAAIVTSVIVMIILVIAVIICYRRKKNEGVFGNEILMDELPPHTWLSIKSHNLGPGSLKSTHSAKDLMAVYENMDAGFMYKEKANNFMFTEEKDLMSNENTSTKRG